MLSERLFRRGASSRRRAPYDRLGGGEALADRLLEPVALRLKLGPLACDRVPRVGRTVFLCGELLRLVRQGVEPAVDTLDLLTVLVSLGRAATGGLESIQQLGVGRDPDPSPAADLPTRRAPVPARRAGFRRAALPPARTGSPWIRAQPRAVSRRRRAACACARPIHCRVHGRGRGRESRVLVGRGLDSRRLVSARHSASTSPSCSRGVLVGGAAERFDFRERRGQLLLVLVRAPRVVPSPPLPVPAPWCVRVC